ncbi:resolvase [Streptomyces adustus]|uniref:Resolvase n=1 Tax=Streptomyces adustus TaxID=1609272 RepID=A0A5N8VFT8_9ACTN|nr:resolvase [Streptomyces adustus]
MRIVGYKRVSGLGQVNDGFGLAIQDTALRGWAKTNGHKLIRIEEDEGVSGAKEAVDRPGLSAALLAVQEGEAEGLLVPKLDRLARALTVQEATLAFVWRAGGRVFAADSGEVLQDDPDDPMRTALRQVVGVFAELDRRIVVKRLKDGRTAKAKAGRKAVGSYAFGTHGQGKGRDRDAAPRPDEQLAVARILELREAGDSYRVIAAALDAEGLKPRRAAQWSAMSVRAVVQRATESSTPRP